MVSVLIVVVTTTTKTAFTELFAGEESIGPFTSTALLVGMVGEPGEKLTAPSISFPTSGQVGCRH